MLFKPLDSEKTYLWFSPSQRLRANFELLWAIYPQPNREKHKMTQEFTSPTLQEFWSTHCQRLLSCFQSSQEVAPFAGWTKAPRCSRLCQNLAFQNWPGKERTPESQFSSPRTNGFGLPNIGKLFRNLAGLLWLETIKCMAWPQVRQKKMVIHALQWSLNWQAWMYPKPSSSWQGLPRKGFNDSTFFYGPRLHLHNISCFILCKESQCIQQNCCGLDNVTSASKNLHCDLFFFQPLWAESE